MAQQATAMACTKKFADILSVMADASFLQYLPHGLIVMDVRGATSISILVLRRPDKVFYRKFSPCEYLFDIRKNALLQDFPHLTHRRCQSVS